MQLVQSKYKIKNTNWAAAWQNQQNDLCAQRKLRSAWASAQSDQSSLCTPWVAKDPMVLHADSKDQMRMPRLSWVFAGAHVILLVLSCAGSVILMDVNVLQENYQQHQLGQFRQKCVLCHMRTTTVQISLRIRADWSTPLLFAA